MTQPPFAEALAPHYDDAVRYCRALCARWSPSDAEDVLQDAFLKALRHYDDLRDPEKFRTWLFTIITRTFYGATRRGFWKRLVPLDRVELSGRIPPLYDRSGPIEDRLLLMKALRVLSNEDRAVILLFELGGFSVAEISRMRGYRTESAVKSRLSRARQKLRDRIRVLEQGKSTVAECHGTPTPYDPQHNEEVTCAR